MATTTDPLTALAAMFPGAGVPARTRTPITITSHCDHQEVWCDNCETRLFVADDVATCEMCGTLLSEDRQPARDCDCGETLNSYLTVVLDGHLPEGHVVRIEGRSTGRQHLSGRKEMTRDALLADPRGALAVDTEVTQVWEFNADGTVSVTQYHHDAPTGESYEVRVVR